MVDLLDRRIADARHELERGLDPAAPDLGAARRRARGRRRIGVVVATVVLVAGVASTVVVTQGEGDADVVAGPVDGTTTSAPPTYGFAPLTPLLDAPPPTVEETVVAEMDGAVLTLAISPEQVAMHIQYPGGGGGGMSGEPMYAPAIISMGSSTSSDAPERLAFHAGLVRPEIRRVEIVSESGTESVDTVADDRFPGLRFFVVALPDRQPDSPPPLVRGLDAEGRLLTDEKRINEEFTPFFDAMLDRAGMEMGRGRVAGYTTSDGGTVLVVSATGCGEEVQPNVTEVDTEVRVDVKVRRPIGAGDCVGGATTTIETVLDEPLGDRVVIDVATGEPVEAR